MSVSESFAPAARSSGYLARSLAMMALPPAPGYRLAPCPHVPPRPRFRLEVFFRRAGWRSQGTGPCRLELAEFAGVSFPGCRFRLVPLE